MDNIDWLSELMEKISLNTFDIGAEYWVDVTHINNPHSFYVRPRAYKRYMPTIQKYTDPINLSDLSINSLVAFESEEVNDYIRGMIFTIDNTDGLNNYNIFALDYGFIENSVSIDCIKQLMPSSLILPPLATHCQLANCKPINDKFTVNSTDAMKSYVGKERAKMVVKEKTSDTLVVELINSCPDDIATLLALTSYTILGYDENKIGRGSAPASEKLYFKYKDLKVGDCVHVRVLLPGKSLTGFFVAEVKDYKKYIKDIRDFSDYCRNKKNLSIEDIKTGSPVGVYVEDTSRYERALVQGIDKTQEKITVQLIDWGTITSVHVCRIRAITSSFFMHPAIAIYCATEESQIWDNEVQKLLYPGYEFLITITKVGDKFISPNIVNISKLN